jgi:hypothetical protein
MRSITRIGKGGVGMTVSYINQTDVSADEDMGATNRQRAVRVIREVKSSPAGVDWQMIRTMRENSRYKEDD